VTEAVIRCADDLVEAFRARKTQRGFSNETVEAMLLMSAGMCDKFLGPNRTLQLNAVVIEDLMTLFGVELVMRINPEARMCARLERRDERQVRPHRRLSKELLALARAQIFKELSAHGNEARKTKVSSKARSRIARTAALCRWKHRRAAASTSEGARA
jgi:hypothetical protein